MKTAAGLLEGWDIMPVTRDQISMLMEGNTCYAAALFQESELDPIPFEAEHLQYLGTPSATQSRAR